MMKNGMEKLCNHCGDEKGVENMQPNWMKKTHIYQIYVFGDAKNYPVIDERVYGKREKSIFSLCAVTKENLIKAWKEYSAVFQGRVCSIWDENMLLMGGIMKESDIYLLNNLPEDEEVKIEVKTNRGTIIARPSNDPYYPGIFIDYMQDGLDSSLVSERPCVVVEETREGELNCLRVGVFGEKGIDVFDSDVSEFYVLAEIPDKDVIATNIEWDTDDEDLESLPTEILESLPTEIMIPYDVAEKGEDAVSEYLSSITGYVHKGFCLNKEDHMQEEQESHKSE